MVTINDVLAMNEQINGRMSFVDPEGSNDQRTLINFRPNEVLASPQIRRSGTRRRRTTGNFR